MREREPGLIRRTFTKNGRLRPTLRVLIYFLMLFVIGGFLLILAALILGTLGFVPTAGTADPLTTSVFALLSLAIVLLVTWLARRLLDRRSLASLGLAAYRGWHVDVAFGVTLGFVLMTLVFLVELAAGWLDVRGFLWQQTSIELALTVLAVGLIQFIAVGVYEEVLSRGYVLQNLEDDWGIAAAVAISSIIFALLHSLNPNLDPFALFNLAVAGIFLAVGYLVTRSLWLPIALHFSWNFFQGTFYGFPVSGGSYQGLIVTQVKGPSLLTGGAFGPEGGILGLAMMLLGIGLLYLWGQSRTRLGAIRRKH